MGFRIAKLNRSLLVIGVALAACSAEAQPAGRRPGQAIIFSSADDDGVSSNLPSLTAKPPGLLDLANAVQSPGVNLGAASQVPQIEPQAPAISPAQTLQMRRLLDEQKNWPFMTPEQIFGLPTQKKILGITDRDALGRPKNESVMAEYYDRQGQSRTRTNNDNYGAADMALRRDFSGNQQLLFHPDIWAPAGSKPDNPALVNQFLNTTPASRAPSALAPQSGWSKSFNLPATPPKPTPEQQAAMEQFRQLLQPHSPSGGAATATALARPIFSPSAVAPGTESPLAVSPGASYTPLSSGITMPSGVTPLPGFFSPTNATPVFAPAWKPQAPPWESTTPQLGVIPQRKF